MDEIEAVKLRDQMIAEMFADWWKAYGRSIDPDTEDVPWYDKREGLAGMAFIAGYRKAMELRDIADRLMRL